MRKQHPFGSFTGPALGALALAATAALTASAQRSGSMEDAQEGGLRRVPPTEEPAANGEQAIDREAWRALLEVEDLAEREGRYADLMRSARATPGALEELEAWVREEGDTRLGWTLRLALRELEREAAPFRGFGRGFGPGSGAFERWFGGSPFGDPRSFQGGGSPWSGGPRGVSPWGGDVLRQLEEQFQDLFGAPMRPGAPGTPAPGPGTGQRSQSFQLESGPDGVRVEVREQENGDETVRTYEAESLEKLFQEHPELRERIEVAPFPSGAGERIEGLFDRLRPRDGGFRGRGGPWQDGGFRWFGGADTGEVPTDRLGILMRPPGQWSSSAEGLEEGVGLYVERVFPGTLAAALGVQPGDVLIELNGRPLRDAEAVAEALAQRAEGEPVTAVRIGRDGERETLRWEPSPPEGGDPEGDASSSG